ncbi:hypothetical protein [Pseudoalteromonas xiamenensis]
MGRLKLGWRSFFAILAKRLYAPYCGVRNTKEASVRILLVIACLIPFTLNASTKNEIVFESGAIVSTCDEYNNLRASQRIAETTSNMIIASEYLECSQMPDLKRVDSPIDIITPISKGLRIRSIPTSLGPQVDRKAVFNDKFVFDGQDSLRFSKDEHSIVLTLKDKLSRASICFGFLMKY